MIANFRNALISIWSNKVRSVLTVLGVVIGVTSVTTLVSLGEGLKKDVSSSIRGFGTNVITVVGGKIDTGTSKQSSNNPANFISGDVLTLKDVDSIKSLPAIQAVSPITVVPGSLKLADKSSTPTLFASYPNILEALSILKLDTGRMFTDSDQDVIILGHNARVELFGEANPLGKKISLGSINPAEFEVIGTLGKAKSVGLFGSEFDAVSMIPFSAGTKLNKNQVKILRIVAKAKDEAKISDVKTTLKEKILANHNNEEDFTILTQDDILSLFDTFLNLATSMVYAIAAISLIVGGIGIMNIMLVTVTERTREIGLRKAVGATKQAILFQFLVEAVVITAVGALLGLLISLAVGLTIAAVSPLKPVITASIVLIAVGISVVVGVIFGLWPAMRAAQKDPIEALRYE